VSKGHKVLASRRILHIDELNVGRGLWHLWASKKFKRGLGGRPERWSNLQDLAGDSRMILKWILNK
jgi:hypothetical protein